MRKVCLFLFLSMLASSALQAADWKDALTEKLRGEYVLTKASKLSKERILGRGTVLVARVEGITGGMPMRISEGRMLPAGGLTQAMLPADQKHEFNIGDRFYITEIKVLHDDAIIVWLVAADPADVAKQGTTIQKRWTAYLRFDYPKDYLRGASIAQLRADFDAIVPTEGQVKSLQPKTVTLGQTIAEVEAIFGKPEAIVNLGARVIYQYKTLKVVFVDGKVFDVQ